jgi:hypothetical protein
MNSGGGRPGFYHPKRLGESELLAAQIFVPFKLHPVVRLDVAETKIRAFHGFSLLL